MPGMALSDVGNEWHCSEQSGMESFLAMRSGRVRRGVVSRAVPLGFAGVRVF